MIKLPFKIPPMSHETRKRAEQAVESLRKREAELAAMTPEEREKAIEAWAKRLAEDTAHLDD